MHITNKTSLKYNTILRLFCLSNFLSIVFYTIPVFVDLPQITSKYSVNDFIRFLEPLLTLGIQSCILMESDINNNRTFI